MHECFTLGYIFNIKIISAITHYLFYSQINVICVSYDKYHFTTSFSFTLLINDSFISKWYRFIFASENFEYEWIFYLPTNFCNICNIFDEFFFLFAFVRDKFLKYFEKLPNIENVNALKYQPFS